MKWHGKIIVLIVKFPEEGSSERVILSTARELPTTCAFVGWHLI